MSFTKIFSAIALATLAAFSMAQDGSVVANVNGDEIGTAEYYHRLEFYRVDPDSPLKTLPVGFLTLKELITERLVFQMAKDKGVAPTQPQIDAEEKDQLAKSPTLLQEMIGQGRTEADLKQDIAYQLAQFNLRTYGVTITDQEVEQHYHDYPSMYKVSRRYKLRVIVVNDDTSAAEVDKDLSSGKAFADVAQQRSLDVSKGNGGEIGVLPASDLGTPVVSALENVKIGSTTAWVHGGAQDTVRVKYLVEDIVPEKQLPLDADLRQQIRKTLSLDKGNVKNSVLKDLQAVTLTAKVSINRPGFQKLYDELIKQYEKAHPSGG